MAAARSGTPHAGHVTSPSGAVYSIAPLRMHLRYWRQEASLGSFNPIAILQRVASASVTVDAHLISSIGKGVLVFAAVAPDDTPREVESMAAKVLKMKMWPDELDITERIVSQFTLLASTKKGSKPDFHGAAGGVQARELYDHFFAKVQELYEPDKVKNGLFQAMMQGVSPPEYPQPS
ncbi:MAG: hypothetical protein Q9167_002220 [Letrouitia subvulpina]